MTQRIILITLFIYAIFIVIISCESESNDPRNSYTGTYDCQVVYNNFSDPENIISDSTYNDTLVVSKAEDPSMLLISGGFDGTVRMDFSNSTFVGVSYLRVSGNFDSGNIYLYHFLTPVALINWTFTGSKISE
jgi:hypothetical protein